MPGSDSEAREFTGGARYAIAALGAVSSLIAPLLIVDIQIIASSLQVAFASDYSGLWLIIAYVIRFAFFVGAGVFWVWALNHHERNAWKLFQLGMVAPAILAGADQSDKRSDLLDRVRGQHQSSYLLISQAFAQDSRTGQVTPTSVADVSWWELIRSGLLLEPLDDPVQRSTREVNEIRESNAALQQQLDSLKQANAALKERVASMEAATQELSNENRVLAEENRTLTGMVVPVTAREEELEAQVAQLEAKIQSITAEIEESQQGQEEDRFDLKKVIVELWDISKVEPFIGFGSLRASVFERGDDLDEAMVYYEALAELAEEDQYPLGSAGAYANLAAVARLRGDNEEAVAAHERQKMSILRSIGHGETGMISIYKDLGVTKDLQEHLDQAGEHHREALELAQQKEFGWGIGAAYLNLGVIAYMDDQMKESEDSFIQAADAFGDANPLGRAMTYNNLAVLYEMTGREELASEYKSSVEETLQSLKR